MRRLSQILLVAALSVSIGLHWAFLQSAAWAGMIVSYSQHATLSDAVRMTFDGEHPCARCHQIQEGRQNEKKHDVKQSPKQQEFCHHHVPVVIAPRFELLKQEISGHEPVTRNQQPALPPPRWA